MSNDDVNELNFRWETEAYVKTILHSVKYPHHPVTGVYLGYIKDSSVIISDAIPLFHNHVLAPSLEVAMIQIEDWAEQNKLKIIGMYYGSDVVDDKLLENLSDIPLALGNKLAQNFDKCFVFILNNRVILPSISEPTNNIAGTMFILNQNQKSQKKKVIESSDWVKTKCSSQNIKESYEIVNNIKEKEIYDFDDHLNNPEYDYLNQNLFDKSKSI